MRHALSRGTALRALRQFGLLTVVGVALTGCGNGKPSESDMKDAAKQKLLSQCTDVVSIEDFKKTNGQDVDANHYIGNVEFDLVLTKDVNVAWARIPKDMTGDPACAWNTFFSVYQGRAGVYKSGTKIYNSLPFIFVKTENGWMLQ